MKKKINVVCASDNNYVIPMMVMLKSLALHTKSEVQVSILSLSISESNKERIRQCLQETSLKIAFYSYDKIKTFDFKTSGMITYASYYRLFIADIIPNMDRCIYLDCDILVERDIEELWNLDINKKTIGAVAEMNPDAAKVSSIEALPLYEIMKIPKDKKYFNAGVLIIDLNLWRQKEYAVKIINYLQKYKDKILWHDQDGMNALLWDDWYEIDPHWNVMTAIYRIEDYKKSTFNNKNLLLDLKNNPSIIHFTDVEKPWCSYCDNPMQYKYMDYLKLI